MSKQSIAKLSQGYDPKPVPKTCVNCRHFEKQIIVISGYCGSYEKDANLRCGIGGFAVKKTATCDRFES